MPFHILSILKVRNKHIDYSKCRAIENTKMLIRKLKNREKKWIFSYFAGKRPEKQAFHLLFMIYELLFCVEFGFFRFSWCSLWPSLFFSSWFFALLWHRFTNDIQAYDIRNTA
jgi:hypothetical protein